SPIVFPVLGEVSYVDDFGQPRPGGKHQGNDLMAPKKSIAVAAEGGKVKFWTTSANAGCMLYLYGDSGTTYIYIHLNNDVGLGNDNKGKCVPGTAFASGLQDGDTVAAREPVGYVGDSGDANGIASHLHFEVHPHGGKAVSPFPFLQKAQHLFFSAVDGETFTLQLTGAVTGVADDQLTVDVSLLREWPAHERVSKPGALTVTLPVERASIAAIEPGQIATLWTARAPASPYAEPANGVVAAQPR